MVRGALALGLGLVVACGDVPVEEHPPPQRLTFGELVYRVARTNVLAAPQCSLEYMGQLEPHHGDFVVSLDHALTAELRADVPEPVTAASVPEPEPLPPSGFALPPPPHAPRIAARNTSFFNFLPRRNGNGCSPPPAMSQIYRPSHGGGDAR